MRWAWLILVIMVVGGCNTSHDRPPSNDLCGNRVIDPVEQCDLSELGGIECTDLGYSGGELICRDDCFFDGTACEGEGECGNGAIDPGEECDDGNDESHDGCTSCVIGEFLASAIPDENGVFPSVASAPDGGFAVAWQDEDGSNLGVLARAFDYRGIPLDDNTWVNVHTEDFQGKPELAFGLSGDLVVTWVSSEQDGEYQGVYSRLLDARGSPVGPERQVNITWERQQYYMDIAVFQDGRYVVAYLSGHVDGGALLARFLSSMGEPVGEEILVSTGNHDMSWPSIGVTSEGFIVSADRQDDLNHSWVSMRAFDQMGDPITATETISPEDGVSRTNSSMVVVADNRLIVAWLREVVWRDHYELVIQCLDMNGTPLGDEIIVDDSVPMTMPGLAVVDEDRVAMIWAKGVVSSEDTDIWGAEFDFSCNQLTPSFIVNTLGDDPLGIPRIDSSGDGRYVIVWDMRHEEGIWERILVKLYGTDGGPAYPGAWR